MRLMEAEIRVRDGEPPQGAPAGARPAIYAAQHRYAIPLACPSAFPFYLDHLVLPHSLPEILWTGLARRWPRLAPILLRLYRTKNRDLHGRQANAAAGTIAEEQCLSREFSRRLGSGPLALLTRNYDENVCGGRTVSFLFEGSSPVPLAVAKLSSEPGQSSALKHEYETLGTLARIFGRESPGFLPRPLDFFEQPPWTVLLESCLPGRTAYFEMRNSWNGLRHTPKHFRSALEWLMVFRQATGTRTVHLTESAVMEHVVQPLEKFSLLACPSTEEFNLIECTLDLARRFLGTQLLLAAGHGDFWSGNLVIDRSSAGVIDWEHFRPEALPFEDLFFFATAYGLNYPWKPAHRAAGETAFRATYLQPTGIADEVRKFLLTYCNATGLPPQLLEVFFPVFLAERALEDYSHRHADGSAACAPGSADMWRRFFRIYAERSEPPCFIERRKRGR